MPEQDPNWMVPIEVMLGSLSHGEIQACSISIIPDEIRKAGENSFKPKVVSIGPLHRGSTRHLQLMEEPKWSYMDKFLHRTENDRRGTRLQDCGSAILRSVKVIKASYGGTVQSEPSELAKIMIVDGCFLLDLLIRLGDSITRNQSSVNPNDPILENEEKVVSVLNDITMLENQIPFIVLKQLYRKVFQDNTVKEDNDHRVAKIVSKAFGYPEVDTSGGAHILHLMHLSTVQQNPQQSQVNKRAEKELKRCAAKLMAAGVIIQPADDHDGSNNNLVDKFNFVINFTGSNLKIPVLRVKKTSEVRWRNLIAWEQSKIWVSCQYTSYALFFQGLICCKHDIEMLLAKRVIVNDSGKSTEELLDLFRTMSNGAERMNSSYTETCEDLNKHRGREVRTVLQEKPLVTWHKIRGVFDTMLYYGRKWYRILIHDHIPTPWKLIGVLAAAALLVLTIMQTYYAAHSGGAEGGGGKGKG